MKEMKTLKFPNQDEPYEIVDAYAREQLTEKLGQSDLNTAVNTALAQAKESGEFDGKNGYSPIKGTDYYTEADKTEIVNRVLSALPTWTGGSY